MLIIQPPRFKYQAQDQGTGFAAATPGRTITASASANTMGSWVQHHAAAAITFDVDLVVVTIGANSGNAADARSLHDIGFDPAGGTSYSVLIPYLLGGCTVTALLGGLQEYVFPIHIPAGSTIASRMQCATGSRTALVSVLCFGGNSAPGSWWKGTGVDALGVATASSKGTTFTPGNATYGSYANIGSTTTRPYHWLDWSTQGAFTGTTWGALGYIGHLAFASGGLIGPIRTWNTNAQEGTSYGIHAPWPVDVPEGSQLQVRGGCSGTAVAQDCAIYGVY